jgi:PmbA protein
MDSEILNDVVRRARKSGMEQIDILCQERNTISASTRLVKLKKLVQADIIDIKIRVSVGNRSAVIATDNLDDLKKDSFLEKVVFAANNAPEEIVAIRPEVGDLCKDFSTADICDDYHPSSEELISAALECEETALQVSGITNSEGAEASYARSKVTLMKNSDFLASYTKTISQISVVPLAEKNEFLERSYDFSEAVYWSDLKDPKQVAQKAAARTLKKLGAKKISSCKIPVVLDRMVSRQTLSNLISAISGAAVTKGISFLKDKLSQKIFNDNFNVVDRCSVARGLRSRPFDSDGLKCFDTIVVKDGVLCSFLLNTKYANQLKMKSTSNASGFEGISPNNIYIGNGKESLQDLLKPIKNGLYVTEVLGNGLNLVTGNYSQGVVGFWIENGEITYPVSEITIAGNFMDMLSHCIPASDLEVESGIDAPTLFINEMIIGGT